MKKFRMTFKKGLLIYALVTAVIIVVGLFFFWDFLADYEKSMPTYGMDYPLSCFENGDVTELADKTEFDGICNFMDGSAVFKKYNEYIRGKKITMVRAKGFLDTKPVYDVKADGKTVAKVYLKSEKKKSSSFKTWTFDKMEAKEYAEDILNLKSITVTVFDNMTVYVNDIKLPADGSPDGVKLERTEQEMLANVKKYTDTIPDIITYTIDGVTDDMPVRVLDEGGSEVELLNEKEGVYSAVTYTDDEFAAEVMEYVDKVVVAYAENFINVRKKILPYVMPSSDLYSSIRITTTGWYPSDEISGYNFDKKEISGIKKYSDDCFSCRVEYIIHVTFKGYSVKDTTEDGNFTWYFVKKDGQWYLTDMNYE